MRKILVVDDDPALVDMVEDALSRQYEVFTALNGTKALQLAHSVKPDLVLCDVYLPHMDGYEILMQLRGGTNTAFIPVVFMTANGDHDTMRRAMGLGAEDFLTKPFTMPDLLQVVETQLQKQQLRQQRFDRTLADLRDNISMSLPHEMRTAIMVVQGYTALLMQDTPPESSSYGMLNEVQKNVDRLVRLSEKYLWYVRSQWRLSSRERSSITQATASLLGDVAIKTARLADRLDDLQIQLEDCTVHAPSEHLIRAFQEIVENAFKFSSRHSPVQIRAACEGDYYRIRVQDQGRGMTPEQIHAIGAFMQFERQRYEQQGTGLGLVIASQIIEQLNGQFIITSNGPDTGACVEFWLMSRAGGGKTVRV